MFFLVEEMASFSQLDHILVPSHTGQNMYLDEYPVYRNMCPSVCRSLYAVLRLPDTQCIVEIGWIWGRDYHMSGPRNGDVGWWEVN
jgi:hypothetical protein